MCVCAVLSDGVMLDAIFFPATPGNLHWKPLPVTHDNTWESVLSHGGFSSHAPPPSPGKKKNSLHPSFYTHSSTNRSGAKNIINLIPC